MFLTHARSNHDDRHVFQAWVVAHVRRDLVTVHTRHLDVEQDNVRNVVLEKRHRIHTVARREYAHTVALEEALRNATHGDGVVDHHREDALVGLLLRNNRLRRAAAPLGANQRTDVENDDDATVAKDRCTGDTADTGDLRTHRLDDNLAAADELVGDETGRVLTGSHEHDGDGDIRLRKRRRLQAYELREMLEAILLAAVIERGGIAAKVGGDFRLRQTQHAFDSRQRQRVKLFAGTHDKRVADGKGER